MNMPWYEFYFTLIDIPKVDSHNDITKYISALEQVPHKFLCNVI